MTNQRDNNKHDASPQDNDQEKSTNEHGELRNGRLSMIKNNNSTGGERENEYLRELVDNRDIH